jgi:hypothetical protein
MQSAFTSSFASNLHKTALQMRQMIETAFCDNAMGRTHSFECPTPSNFFSNMETLVENCEDSNQPSTGCTDKNTKKVHKLYCFIR